MTTGGLDLHHILKLDVTMVQQLSSPTTMKEYVHLRNVFSLDESMSTYKTMFHLCTSMAPFSSNIRFSEEPVPYDIQNITKEKKAPKGTQ